MARRTVRPLDETGLRELAVADLGRYATTRAKLSAYLRRKVRERGWDGADPPDPDGLAERFASQGYIDDSGYALMKSRALAGRGYGKRRIAAALNAAGVAGEDGFAAIGLAEEEAVAAALRFAERRRIGPFAAKAPSDRAEQEKAIGAMVRAGHSFGLAKAIVRLPPGADIDRAALEAAAGH
jgi:regulatory protein